MHELAPVATRPRRPIRTGVLLAATLGGSVVAHVVVVLALCPEPAPPRILPPTVSVVVVAPPAVPVAPIAEPPTPPVTEPRVEVAIRSRDRACPARHLRATPVERGRLPDGLTKLGASWFDVRLLAAWNDEHVYLSTDEGRSFHRVLDGPGKVAHVAFDCHGNVHAARVLEDGSVMLAHFVEGATTQPSPERVGGVHTWRYNNGVVHVDDVRLVPDAGGMAVLAADPGARDRLMLVREEVAGRWRATRLLDRAAYTELTWDGIQILRIEPRSGNRVRVIASAYQAGECGDNRYIDAVINLERAIGRVVSTTELPPDEHDLTLDGVPEGIRDAAGRWLAIVRDDGGDPYLARWTARELVERFAASGS
jgi:hypothetical protein